MRRKDGPPVRSLAELKGEKSHALGTEAGSVADYSLRQRGYLRRLYRNQLATLKALNDGDIDLAKARRLKLLDDADHHRPGHRNGRKRLALVDGDAQLRGGLLQRSLSFGHAVGPGGHVVELVGQAVVEFLAGVFGASVGASGAVAREQRTEYHRHREHGGARITR